MKPFLYAFFILLLVGGGYALLVDQSPPENAAVGTWNTEAQSHLSTLLADQLKIAQGQDRSSFEAHLKSAEAHLAAAPAEADSATFRTAIQAYRAQQNARQPLE